MGKIILKSASVAALILLATTTMTITTSAQVDNRQQVIDIGRGDTLNLREGPGSKFRDVGDLKRNQYVPVLGYDPTGRWAKVLWRGQELWASARYLSGGVGGQNLNPNIGTSSQTYAPGLGPHVVTGVLADDPRGLALRAGPSTRFKLEQYIGDGVEVFVIQRSQNGNWAFVKFMNGTGWLWTKYIAPIANSQPNQQANSGNQASAGQGGGNSQALNEVQMPDGQPLPAVFRVINVASNDVLHVRRRPRSNARILGSYAGGQSVTVLAYFANGWARVNIGQDVGFVNADFLTRGGGVTTENGMQLGLMCRGTEPFWSLKIDDDRTVQFSEINSGNEPLTSLTQATPSPLTNSYPYNFSAMPYTGTVTQQICSDGMSDISYGWGITLVKPKQGGGWETFNGCCNLQ